MNWKPGPARTRDGREARIYAVDGGSDKHLIHGALLIRGAWLSQTWYIDGRMVKSKDCPEDLLPPKLSRDEVAAQCAAAYMASYRSIAEDIRAALDHYDKLRREGLCDE